MANRDRDVLGVKEVGLVLPVQARSGNPGVRQPVESDAVEEVVAREGVRQVSAEDPLDETGLPGAVAVVEGERRGSMGESASPYSVCGRVAMICA